MSYTLCTVTVDSLNIRTQPTSQSARVASYSRGTVLNFIEVVNGENVDGNAHWGHSEQGHYFWLGGTDHPNGNPSGGNPPVENPPVGNPPTTGHCQEGTPSSNLFPQGQCTWWANERYHQLHGYYVPWTTESNAYQWVDRANQFHWHTSSQPKQGAIIVLQPNVQWASGEGHVGVVEQVEADGKVLVSNLNWGVNQSQRSEVTNWTFSVGQGVMFVWCE